jgi:multiple sugar transport system permease protein
MARGTLELGTVEPIVIPKPPGLLRQIYKHRYEYLYVAPALGVMGLVILYPLIDTILLSFFRTPLDRPERVFVGLANYVELFNHNLFGLVMWNTIYWTIGSTIVAFVIGLGAALLINQKLPGMRIFSGILVIPYVIGHVVASYAWRWLLHSDFGVLNHSLIELGLIDRPIRFLQSPEWVMTSLVIVNIWKTFPFCMIMVLAGLQAIPQDLYKAAKVDGANGIQRFVEITIPQLMPVIMVTTILSIIGNFNSFTIPWVMTGGGPAHQSEIIITWIYNTSFQTLRFGFASAISVVLFLILFAFSFVYVRALTRDTPSSVT